MYQFNGKAITFGYYNLKAISQSTLDPKITFVDKAGNTTKLALPSAIGRVLSLKLNKVSKFNVEYPCCIAMLEGRIIAVDAPRNLQYANWKDTGEWTSPIERNIEVVKYLDSRQWLFDGQYAYRFEGPLAVVQGSNFASQPVQAYNLFKLDIGETIAQQSLSCLAFKKNATEYQITSPVTRASGGFLQLTGDVDVYNHGDEFGDGNIAQALMLMDRNYIVNLKFVNYAAKRITDVFGFEAIEPLGLPLLMVEHRTMSIVSLPQSVQQSSPAPMKYTEAVAWVIGMFGRISNLEELIVIKSVLKMLLSKGNTQTASESLDVQADSDVELSLKQKVEALRAKFEGAALIKF